MSSKYRICIASLLSILLIATDLLAEAPPAQIVRLKLIDTSRKREVPVKIYLPKVASADKLAPVVLFSHGLGGSCENYAYLGDCWSSHGYVSVHLQHHGSDDLVWKKTGGTSLIAAANYQNFVERAKDVSFVLDQLEKLNHDPKSIFNKKLDLDRIAMAGHSFGAYTTMAVAGQVVNLGEKEITFVDKRIKCAIAMSPSPPITEAQRNGAYSKIEIPVFYLTGTRDTVMIQPIKPEDRKIPYQMTNATDQYLLVFKDGDHMLFAGRGVNTPMIPLVEKSTTAFLDAYLQQDDKSRDYLRNRFADELKDSGNLEWK